MIAYVLRTSHGLKNLASRYGVTVVFSTLRKLEGMCAAVQRKASLEERAAKSRCGRDHEHRYVDCQTGAVYQVPLSCGASYIGQAGRCANVRLREHALSFDKRPRPPLPSQCHTCGCHPVFKETDIVSRHPKQLHREIVEAYHIKKRVEKCVSHPSGVLTDKEVQFMDNDQ